MWYAIPFVRRDSIISNFEWYVNKDYIKSWTWWFTKVNDLKAPGAGLTFDWVTKVANTVGTNVAERDPSSRQFLPQDRQELDNILSRCPRKYFDAEDINERSSSGSTSFIQSHVAPLDIGRECITYYISSSLSLPLRFESAVTCLIYVRVLSEWNDKKG